MKTENQVCSVEQSKRLRDLGVMQKVSFFYWFIHADGTGSLLYNNSLRSENLCADAFNVAELGVMLPDSLCDDDLNDYWPTWSYQISDKSFNTYYQCNDLNDDIPTIPKRTDHRYSNEAQSRAALLIFLLEAEKIPISLVNNRLINS